MNKLILKIVAILALLVQVLIPMWWGAIFASFYYFWVEGIIEGGVFKLERIIDIDQAGNEIVKILPYSFSTLLWGLFSVFCIIAAIVSIKVSFSIKMNTPELTYNKRDILFLLINVATISLAIFFVVWNGGLVPKL
ncbi:MAG: hypothetical protein Q7R78_00980 [bacterium]|nr:hypothetical protein [bacterium]